VEVLHVEKTPRECCKDSLRFLMGQGICPVERMGKSLLHTDTSAKNSGRQLSTAHVQGGWVSWRELGSHVSPMCLPRVREGRVHTRHTRVGDCCTLLPRILTKKGRCGGSQEKGQGLQGEGIRVNVGVYGWGEAYG
jgi:hypothetical protein